jgi:hypothetical protein
LCPARFLLLDSIMKQVLAMPGIPDKRESE